MSEDKKEYMFKHENGYGDWVHCELISYPDDKTVMLKCVNQNVQADFPVTESNRNFREVKYYLDIDSGDWSKCIVLHAKKSHASVSNHNEHVILLLEGKHNEIQKEAVVSMDHITERKPIELITELLPEALENMPLPEKEKEILPWREPEYMCHIGAELDVKLDWYLCKVVTPGEKESSVEIVRGPLDSQQYKLNNENILPIKFCYDDGLHIWRRCIILESYHDDKCNNDFHTVKMLSNYKLVATETIVADYVHVESFTVVSIQDQLRGHIVKSGTETNATPRAKAESAIKEQDDLAEVNELAIDRLADLYWARFNALIGKGFTQDQAYGIVKERGLM